MPSDQEIWEKAVNIWLHHVENAYVENVLLKALEKNGNDIEGAIQWLIDENYDSLIGNFGYGPGDENVNIDVHESIRADNFIEVYVGIRFRMSITLTAILKWLKNGKKTNGLPTDFALKGKPASGIKAGSFLQESQSWRADKKYTIKRRNND